MSSSHFDAKGLYTLVEKMAYPRLMGTPGEKQIITQIKGEFQKRGFGPADIISHQIRPTTWMSGLFMQVMNGVIATILLGILLTWIASEPVFLWIWIAAFIVAAIFFGSRTDPTKWTVGTIDSENIFVRIPPQKEKRGTILFASHFDSKSQLFPTFMRAIFYIVGIILGVLFLLVTLVNVLLVTAGQPDSFPLFVIAQILGWPATGCFICLLFNKVQNNSNGAGDNATGMAIVLELARNFKARGGLDHFETIFAIFSAEEVGVVGSAFWAQKYARDLNPATSFMFNFDMVGKPVLQYMSHFGFARKPTNCKLNPLVTAVAKDLNIPLADFSIPVGAMTDRWPFAKLGWESVDFITRALSLQAHTPYDTMANIDGEVLAQACEVVRISAEKIDMSQI